MRGAQLFERIDKIVFLYNKHSTKFVPNLQRDTFLCQLN